MTSFFAKKFSTTARPSPYNAVLSARRENIRRRVTPSSGERADYTAVTAHMRRKGHDAGRGRTHSLKADDEAVYGAMDTRLRRAKSPRNLQYLQRGEEQTDLLKTYTRKEFLTKRRLAAAPDVTAFPASRDTRAFTVLGHNTPVATDLKIVQAARAEYQTRRRPVNVTARSEVVEETVHVPVHRRLYTNTEVVVRRNTREQEIELLSLNSTA